MEDEEENIDRHVRPNKKDRGIILYHGSLAELNSLGIGKFRIDPKRIHFQNTFVYDKDRGDGTIDFDFNEGYLIQEGLDGLVNMRTFYAGYGGYTDGTETEQFHSYGIEGTPIIRERGAD